MENTKFDSIIRYFYNTHRKVDTIFDFKKYDWFDAGTIDTIVGISEWKNYVRNNEAEIRAKFEFCKRFDVK